MPVHADQHAAPAADPRPTTEPPVTSAPPTTATPPTGTPTSVPNTSPEVIPVTLPATLPATGSSDTKPVLLFGLVLVPLGAVLVLATRRRAGAG